MLQICHHRNVTFFQCAFGNVTLHPVRLWQRDVASGAPLEKASYRKPRTNGAFYALLRLRELTAAARDRRVK